jgi:hypothetical protein
MRLDYLLTGGGEAYKQIPYRSGPSNNYRYRAYACLIKKEIYGRIPYGGYEKNSVPKSRRVTDIQSG